VRNKEEIDFNLDGKESGSDFHKQDRLLGTGSYNEAIK
jgi:hypothetical protein